MEHPRTEKNPTGQEFSRCSIPRALIRPQGTPCLSDSTASHFNNSKAGCENLDKFTKPFHLSPAPLAQPYFTEHSKSYKPPSAKEKSWSISKCKEPSDSKKSTSFSGFISHISSHCTFFNAVKGPDFKGRVSHYLIPAREREEDKAEVSWRDVYSSLSSTVLCYFVSHPPNPLPADTPVLAENLPV